MNNIFKTAIEHPFATVFVIAGVGRAVASIISAARGIPISPIVSVVTTKAG